MRRRLTLLVAATSSVVLLAFLIPVAVLTGDLAESSALRRALAQTQSLVAVAGTSDTEALQAAVTQVQSDGLRVTVYRASGPVLGAPVPRDAAIDDTARTARSSVRTSAGGGRVILQPVFGDGGTQVVRVEVSRKQLERGVARARTILVLLALVLFVGCVLVADLLAKSLTRPIDALADAAERLAEGDLETRVEPDGPRETREVALALNRLATRIGELLADERELVADLSHRLRTPVTVLRLDAETLSDPADRTRLTADVDELTRQVDAVIAEARRTEREGGGARCDASDVVRERTAFWRALAEDQGRSFEVRVPAAPMPVRLARADLAAALDALLGNVLAHTPEGAALRVVAEPIDGGGAVVSVEDAGPGFADLTWERGRSGSGSTGLGLDIARRTTEASGGELEVGRSTDLGGSRVTLRLGAAAD